LNFKETKSKKYPTQKAKAENGNAVWVKQKSTLFVACDRESTVGFPLLSSLLKNEATARFTKKNKTLLIRLHALKFDSSICICIFPSYLHRKQTDWILQILNKQHITNINIPMVIKYEVVSKSFRTES
jgi:hypothetical protein